MGAMGNMAERMASAPSTTPDLGNASGGLHPC
jgi:hypothetical protein